MTLVSVILKSQQTQYQDTKALLDFGFQNFQTVSAAEYDTTYVSVDNDMTIAGLSASELSGIAIDPDSSVTIPKSADFSSVSSQLTYELDQKAPEEAIARIDYRWGERKIGSAYLNLKTIDRTLAAPVSGAAQGQTEAAEALQTQASEHADVNPITQDAEPASDPETNETLDSDSPAAFHIPSIVWKLLGGVIVAAVLVGIFLLIRIYQEKKEEEARMHRRQKRLSRLEDSGISSAQFDLLMEQKRSSYTTTRSSGRKKRRRSSRRHFR